MPNFSYLNTAGNGTAVEMQLNALGKSKSIRMLQTQPFLRFRNCWHLVATLFVHIKPMAGKSIEAVCINIVMERFGLEGTLEIFGTGNLS